MKGFDARLEFFDVWLTLERRAPPLPDDGQNERAHMVTKGTMRR